MPDAAEKVFIDRWKWAPHAAIGLFALAIILLVYPTGGPQGLSLFLAPVLILGGLACLAGADWVEFDFASNTFRRQSGFRMSPIWTGPLSDIALVSVGYSNVAYQSRSYVAKSYVTFPINVVWTNREIPAWQSCTPSSFPEAAQIAAELAAKLDVKVLETAELESMRQEYRAAPYDKANHV